jgi:hypothetical protein
MKMALILAKDPKMTQDEIELVDGRRRPLGGRAVWHLPQGSFAYADFRLIPGTLVFNVPPDCESPGFDLWHSTSAVLINVVPSPMFSVSSQLMWFDSHAMWF